MTVQNAITITSAAGAAISIDPAGRAGPGAIVIKAAVGSTPNATLPIGAHRDIDFPTRIELEARLVRRRATLCCNPWIDGLGTSIHNAERPRLIAPTDVLHWRTLHVM